MKPPHFIPLAALTLLTAASAVSCKSTSGTAVTVEKGLVNTAGASGIALSGYDPVAFFTVGKALHGEPEITSSHKGAIYMFSSRENKHIFSEEPEKYAPQYGGFSALGVSFGALKRRALSR